MKADLSSRGAIHLLGPAALLFLILSIFLLSNWIIKVDNLSAKVVILEKTIEGMEAKIKYLELKSHSDKDNSREDFLD